MSNFFKTFLACFLAIVFFVFILFFFGLLSASLFSSSANSSESTPSNGILKINTNTSITAAKTPSLSGYAFAELPVSSSLTEVLAKIKKAGTDSKIEAILIESNGNAISVAFQNELISALQDFRLAGKKVYAYSTYMSQGGYYLATVADKIVVHPKGMLTINGFDAQVMFYKGLMDKLGIEPQITYAGKFKSATEPYRLYKMSDENRQQTSILVDNFWRLMLDRISAARDISATELTDIINNGEAIYPEDALKHGLIDAMAYEDKFYEDLGKELGWDEETDPEDKIIELSDYTAKVGKSSAQIALIDMEGTIRGDQSSDEISDITENEYLPIIDEVHENDNIKAVVLHINSGGGDAVVSDKIWHAVKKLATDKPVVCYMSGVSASGGYYISCAAPTIVAQPHSITGSIGVFQLGFNGEKLFNDKLGITFDHVKKGDLAGYGSFTAPMSDKEKKITQNFVDRVYDDFKSVVARGRNLSMDEVESLASGRVYTGTDALNLGLVDSMGYLDDALGIAAREAGITSREFREYPNRVADPMKLFFSELAVKIFSEPRLDADILRFSSKLQELKSMNGRAQMIMPYDIQFK